MDPVVYGTAVWTGSENILYFGGRVGSTYQTKVWRYKPDGSSDWSQVGGLPRIADLTSSVWDQSEYSYVFGGHSGIYSKTISRFSSATNVSVVVGELPGPRCGTSAFWDEVTGDVYVFGGFNSGGRLKDIVKFNPAKETVVKLNVTLPLLISYSCAIWTGTEAYVIGGTTSGQAFNFVRFNPSTHEVLNVPVDNLPSNLELHGCAFVSKLNRIYVFGGRRGGSGNRRDEIMYIDLGPIPTAPTTTTPFTTTLMTTPMTTTTTPITTTSTTPLTTTKEPGGPTDCKNELCGTRFPNPSCCESYYQCENQEAVFRQCPSQLQFNPSHAECDLPEIVKCRSTYE